ncbi:hypothetical protein CesoFtcFv8_021438 [Champsocephalus esox]|uniref:Uncharacterized protein n=1 Tax=Champsocephalus esox TaxID=159716 RepID=A0AAN8BDR7_9TELE|nr:hypothetical protein CesoFtcFv8_021438 [Champsocephalus esox]
MNTNSKQGTENTHTTPPPTNHPTTPKLRNHYTIPDDTLNNTHKTYPTPAAPGGAPGPPKRNSPSNIEVFSPEQNSSIIYPHHHTSPAALSHLCSSPPPPALRAPRRRAGRPLAGQVVLMRLGPTVPGPKPPFACPRASARG